MTKPFPVSLAVFWVAVILALCVGGYGGWFYQVGRYPYVQKQWISHCSKYELDEGAEARPENTTTTYRFLWNNRILDGAETTDCRKVDVALSKEHERTFQFRTDLPIWKIAQHIKKHADELDREIKETDALETLAHEADDFTINVLNRSLRRAKGLPF